jgi:ribonucleoside-diphosphate reductase alpha chain
VKEPQVESFTVTFKRLTPCGTEKVYDVQVPGVNAFSANLLEVSNCGEQPLLPMEACNLGSINLTKMLTHALTINYGMLVKTIKTAMYFLDNTISVGKYPLPEIDQMVKGNRKIGLGVMGFADMLYMMNIPYNSKQALVVAEDVMSFIQDISKDVSRKMAIDIGVFPNYKNSIHQIKCRNATTTTIAPTGTLSIIANCSSGIEPIFALSYVRNVMDNDKLVEVNPYFEKTMKDRGIYSIELMDKIAKAGSIQHIDGIPEDIKKIFVTSHDISPEYHVRMQAAFQRYNDSAVSKTVNLPREATEKDVRNVYDLAYELKCKGVTIYRDGSKENQVLSCQEAEKKSATQTTMSASGAAKGMMELGKLALIQHTDRPEILEGFTAKIKTGMGNLYVTVTEHDGNPFEVFATIGRSGKSVTAKTEAIGRLTSLALRSGIRVEKVVEQLKGICGEHPVFQEGGMVLSIPDAIGKILEKRYVDKKETKKTTCPECGSVIVYEEGCIKCHGCGYSKCS